MADILVRIIILASMVGYFVVIVRLVLENIRQDKQIKAMQERIEELEEFVYTYLKREKKQPDISTCKYCNTLMNGKHLPSCEFGKILRAIESWEGE